jgi:hypothetical protein
MDLKDKKIKVYVAGPYRQPDRCFNVNTAIKTADMLVNLGFIPYIPHLCHYWNLVSPKEEEFYMDYDLEWLKICDCLFIIPGESKGVRTEIEEAKKLNIPYFLETDDLINYWKFKESDIYVKIDKDKYGNLTYERYPNENNFL